MNIKRTLLSEKTFIPVDLINPLLILFVSC